MADSAAPAKKVERVLLPATVVPSHYKLCLEPDLDKFTFDGHVAITVAVAAPTTTVTVHAKELDIREVTFAPAGSTAEPLAATALAFDLEEMTLTVTFKEALPAGAGVLAFTFVGQLNNQMAGFYRSGYTAANGEKRVMASTQFEALDARRCFPCWDEPARKATFGVTLVVPADRHVFSNMPEAEATELPGGRRRRVTFMDSPVMSTYLVAFCVGEFDFVQARTRHGVLVKVYTPPGKSAQGHFSLACATQALDFYDDYFGIAYPLPKLDMVAIPEFAMGAMENWGLVTYREADLLVDPATASSEQKQRVCTVVTHELAHQWFGNLVTMQWWDDLWLNEGFASWMQTFAADHIFPRWHMWEQYVMDDLVAALRLDGLRTSHPIQVPIAHAQEVEQVFDAISYCKGCTVVRLLAAILGPDAFQRGLRLYMARHQYGNTETTDLWAAWAEASGKPIAAIMDTWTNKMGFPLLTVTSATLAADQTAWTLELAQSWYLADGSADTEQDKLWQFPLLAGGHGVVGGPSADAPLMTTRTHTLVVPVAAPAGGDAPWVMLNFGQHVPMRVLYPPALLPGLEHAFRTKAMPAADRAALLMDHFNLAKSGHVSPAAVIRLLACCTNEDDATVWDAISTVLVALDKLLLGQPAVHEAFHALAAALVTPAARRTGWEPAADDGHLGTLLRATLVGLLGRFVAHDPTVVAEATARFNALVADPASATACPADFRVAVFKIVLRAAKDEAAAQAVYTQLLALLAAFDNNADKKHVMHALGAAPSAKLRRATLDWATSGAVKLQDFFYPILSVSSSGKEGLELTWAYFQENWRRMKKMIEKASPSLMDAVIVYSCGGFTSLDKAAEIEAFFKATPFPDNERKIAQMLEDMRTSAAFVARVEQTELADPAFWAGLTPA